MQVVARVETEAWLLLGGSRRLAGTLQLREAQLLFCSDTGVIFGAPLADVAARFPWHYFGCGLKLAVGRNTYRLTFTPPGLAVSHLQTARRAADEWRGALAHLPVGSSSFSACSSEHADPDRGRTRSAPG